MQPHIFWMTCLTLVSSLLLGGGAAQRLAVEGVPEFFSIILIGFLCPKSVSTFKLAPLPGAILIAILLLPLIQLVPLPPWIWGGLPGRELILEIYRAAGVDISWRPISFVPASTIRSFLALLPATAIYLGVLNSNEKARLIYFLIAIFIGVASSFQGLLQVIDGPSSSYYYYQITNWGPAVGFFANSNHFAALQYSLIPLAAAMLIDLRKQSTALILCFAIVVFPSLLIGLLLSGSRSAIILGIPAIILSVFFTMREDLIKLWRRHAMLIVSGAILSTAVLIAGGSAFKIVDRFQSPSVTGDLRWKIAAISLPSFQNFFPVGSGFGTFPSVYPLIGGPSDIIYEFVNHAHNDWLEIAIDGGIAPLLLVCLFVFWLVKVTKQNFRSALNERRFGALAGSIVMWLLMVHSCWDYPLRTIALSGVFALCTGMQIQPPRETSEVKKSLRSRASEREVKT
jgi:hypothetical protein